MKQLVYLLLEAFDWLLDASIIVSLVISIALAGFMLLLLLKFITPLF